MSQLLLSIPKFLLRASLHHALAGKKCRLLSSHVHLGVLRVKTQVGVMQRRHVSCLNGVEHGVGAVLGCGGGDRDSWLRVGPVEWH